MKSFLNSLNLFIDKAHYKLFFYAFVTWYEGIFLLIECILFVIKHQQILLIIIILKFKLFSLNFTSQISIRLLVTKPEDSARSEEATLRVSLQPLRLNVDQVSWVRVFFLF